MSIALLRMLRENAAATGPGAKDPRLRGRTYAVPFERVWRASLALADRELKGWRVVQADDCEGVIRAEATARFPRLVADVTIRITLDADAQTRVDASARSRTPRGDWGASVRLLDLFFTALDRMLESGGPPAPRVRRTA